MASLARLADRWPPRDRLGRAQPHRFALPSYLLQPGPIGQVFADAFDRTVPASFCAADVDEHGEEIGVIACPCGKEPIVYPLRTAECECGRFYLNLATEVRVYRPDGVEAGLPEPVGASSDA